jgi:hypothetical protein
MYSDAPGGPHAVEAGGEPRGPFLPDRVDPFFFRVRPGRRAKAAYGDGRYASQYYAVAR